MHKNRIRVKTKHRLKDGSYVLYWMQHTQRLRGNFALEAAISYANKIQKPLKLLFVLTPNFKDANLRHYAFMLEGVQDVASQCEALNIDFCLEVGEFEAVLKDYLNAASLLVLDDAYMPFMVDVKKKITAYADGLNVPVIQVFSDTIVPVDQASQKCEYSARTIRKKLHQQVDAFLAEASLSKVDVGTSQAKPVDIDALLKKIDIDRSVLPSKYFKGGETEAYKRLDDYLECCLKDYHDSSDPGKDVTSKLSPYLHFGQISPIDMYQMISTYIDTYPEAVEALIEQLLVRRELAFNFVTYCEGFDRFETMTYGWAYETMAVHRDDRRTYLYSEEDYIAAKTHDVYFNAAMIEMVETGFMHNTMRMYWGKKIIEWSEDYETAYAMILKLNNRYFIDGRDPVSYASVAWLFGRHDRAWQSREIFGKLRYMNDKGLKRKYDMDRYLKRMEDVKSDSDS